MEIVQNTTPFSLSIYEKNGFRRVYIAPSLGRLGQTIYFDLDEMKMRLKGNRNLVSDWTAREIDEIIRVTSSSSHDYFDVAP